MTDAECLLCNPGSGRRECCSRCTRQTGGGSVSSKYRLQQKRSLKYFIASSPEMKKRGVGEARGEIKGKIWREAERHEEVEGGRKGFMRV